MEHVHYRHVSPALAQRVEAMPRSSGSDPSGPRHPQRHARRPWRAYDSPVMKRNTQRLIAGLLVFVMIAALMVGFFADSGEGLQPASPTQRTSGHQAD